MDPIDILERRIAALELKVLPLQNINEETQPQTVTDMLLQVNTLISSALSCREVVTGILNRMTELNDCLDPNFYENTMDIDAKRQFILTLYPDIKKYGEAIQQLKSKVPVLDSDSIKNVPGLVPKLEQLSLNTLKACEQSQNVNKSVVDALKQYNDIVFSISRTFIQLEELVTHIEFEMKSKAAVE